MSLTLPLAKSFNLDKLVLVTQLVVVLLVETWTASLELWASWAAVMSSMGGTGGAVPSLTAFAAILAAFSFSLAARRAARSSSVGGLDLTSFFFYIACQ